MSWGVGAASSVSAVGGQSCFSASVFSIHAERVVGLPPLCNRTSVCRDAKVQNVGESNSVGIRWLVMNGQLTINLF